jgi:hypothetical protein
VLGELLNERFQVFSILGKGVFSAVVKARDITTTMDVAIKIIRNNEVMYKAGQKELGILKKLQDSDPAGRKHVVRMLNHFEHRNHLCIVFESLRYHFFGDDCIYDFSMNLREVLKKYGVNRGLNIKVAAQSKRVSNSTGCARLCAATVLVTVAVTEMQYYSRRHQAR